MGSLSTRFKGAQYLFAAGATTASFVFFFALGFGARYLRPLFARAIAWTLLDIVIGIMMWGIGLELMLGR